MEHALDVLPVGARLKKVTEQPGVRHGRAGLRVELTRETVDAQDCVDSNTFVVLPVDFCNGEIEVDMLGTPVPLCLPMRSISGGIAPASGSVALMPYILVGNAEGTRNT